MQNISRCYVTLITREVLTHVCISQIEMGLMTDQSTDANKVQLEVTYRKWEGGVIYRSKNDSEDTIAAKPTQTGDSS